ADDWPGSGCNGVGYLRGRRIGPKVALAIYAQNILQTGPGATDAALDGANSATTNFCSLFIGEAGSSNQDDGFALVFRQQTQSLAKIIQVRRTILGGMNG